jgi:glycine C-acetyltransferase
MSSVRFICGTQDVHKELEAAPRGFLGTEDTSSTAVPSTPTAASSRRCSVEDDAVISDALNHASIIDGIRLCKAKRYATPTTTWPSSKPGWSRPAPRVQAPSLIATDGVFSMDGFIANLQAICDLADRYGALTMVDDCHATGFIGAKGRGTAEHCGVMGRVDIITGTLGKALGGASGGFTCARKEIVGWLRQRSRPYLFSNTVAPVIAATSLAALDLAADDGLRAQLRENAHYFRREMTRLGFELKPGSHPIIPVMLGDAKLASAMAEQLLEEGVYVVGFSFPVVPRGQARIRTQMSAAHRHEDLEVAVKAFARVGRALGVIR